MRFNARKPGDHVICEVRSTTSLGDHPHTDPGDGRTECDVCGKWVFECTHSCKGVPVTEAAMARFTARTT